MSDQDIADEIKALTVHPVATDEYSAGYQDARNDAWLIAQEAADNSPSANPVNVISSAISMESTNDRNEAMAKETRVWNDAEWVCLFVNDGNTQTTISLSYDEAFDLAQKLMPRAEFAPDTVEELRMAARMIRRWIPEAFPENTLGQIHFVRAVIESVAGAIERALDRKPPLSREDAD